MAHRMDFPVIYGNITRPRFGDGIPGLYDGRPGDMYAVRRSVTPVWSELC